MFGWEKWAEKKIVPTSLPVLRSVCITHHWPILGKPWYTESSFCSVQVSDLHFTYNLSSEFHCVFQKTPNSPAHPCQLFSATGNLNNREIWRTKDLLSGSWRKGWDDECFIYPNKKMPSPKCSIKILQEAAKYLLCKHEHFSDLKVGSDVPCLKVTHKENSWRKEKPTYGRCDQRRHERCQPEHPK